MRRGNDIIREVPYHMVLQGLGPLRQYWLEKLQAGICALLVHAEREREYWPEQQARAENGEPAVLLRIVLLCLAGVLVVVLRLLYKLLT
jgi:hypothetical protein